MGPDYRPCLGPLCPVSGDFQIPRFATWLFLDQVNFWMGGPRDLVSQLHYDGGINLLAQVPTCHCFRQAQESLPARPTNGAAMSDSLK